MIPWTQTAGQKNIFADSNGKVCFHWDFTRPAPEINLAGVVNTLIMPKESSPIVPEK